MVGFGWKLKVYQSIVWQECSKSGQKGHFSFTTKQNFISWIGELFLAPPLSGYIIGVAHDLQDYDFNLSKYIHSVHLEKKSLELADAFEIPEQLEFVEYLFSFD